MKHIQSISAISLSPSQNVPTPCHETAVYLPEKCLSITTTSFYKSDATRLSISVPKTVPDAAAAFCNSCTSPPRISLVRHASLRCRNCVFLSFLPRIERSFYHECHEPATHCTYNTKTLSLCPSQNVPSPYHARV